MRYLNKTFPLAFLIGINIIMVTFVGSSHANEVVHGVQIGGLPTPNTHGSIKTFNTSELINVDKRYRFKRSPTQHVITDCMTVTSDEGRFFFKSVTDSSQTCGLYLMADPDQVIEVKFGSLNVPCDSGLLSFVDGWELNGEYFPSRNENKNFDNRYHEFCGVRKRSTAFVSSQNAALIQYRIPYRGHGFSIQIKHIQIPNPCNILIEGSTNYYTLRNFGNKINCSLTAMYPAKIQIMAMDVGRLIYPLGDPGMTGTINNCRKRGLADYVEIGGSSGLDTLPMLTSINLCGYTTQPDRSAVLILCRMSTVRLFSSGSSNNAVTVLIDQATQDDLPVDYTLLCQSK